MVNLITEHRDIWTTAQMHKSNGGRGRRKNSNGQNLHGIKKLRELILELAVRGKLVPQDPNDEPASVLLKKIAKEKARLIKEGKIKKQKSLLGIGDDEKPFELPKGWEWARFGNISYQITDGTHYTPTYVSEGIPFISVKDMSSGFLDFSKTRFISKEQHEELTKRCNPQRGDLLLTKVGTTGIPVLIETDIPFSIFVSVALIKFAQAQISGNFLSLLVKSPLVMIQSKEGTEGIGNKNLVLRKIVAFLIAIPPLSEQHRIVAKVDELMTLCDQLEQQQTGSNATHETLVETLLATLTNAADQRECAKAWQRIANHFDTLFTTELSLDQLKQTILQLAAMGKLAPQDPNDEPANVLLKKIAKEKARLIKEGKIKKQKTLPEINEEEKPFDLPNGWKWTRLGSTGLGSTGKTPSTRNPKYYGGNIPFIGPGQITPDGEIIDSDKTLTKAGCEYSAIAESGDILMVCIGGSIGKSAIARETVTFNQQINCIRPLFVDSKYLNVAMNTPHFQTSILDTATGSATPIINRSKWEELLVALPPLAEQYRIIAKADEMMTLCDTLKFRLNDAQITQVQLADAIVDHAVA